MKKAKKWNQPCPNKNCKFHGMLNEGNITSRSTYMTQSGKRRIFNCNRCGTNFSETRDTVFFDLRTPENKIIIALKMILVKVGLSDISFVLGIKEETLLVSYFQFSCFSGKRIIFIPHNQLLIQGL